LIGGSEDVGEPPGSGNGFALDAGALADGDLR
jgi:hypothetical protein